MDVYELITNQIMEQLEKGNVPWQRPWVGGEAINLVSKKPYRGINVFILAAAGYASPYWLSLKQANDLGGSVRKGERSTMVVFWKRNQYIAKDPTTEEDIIRQGLILRYYRVFNVEQCENLDLSKIPEVASWEFNAIEECDRIVDTMPNKPDIRFEEQRAYYSPSGDYVNMPKQHSFVGNEEYYSILFHELTHSTGHEARLNRKGVSGSDGQWSSFGSKPYAMEELVAEMGAAYLCGHVGIENKTIDNSAAYIQSWLGRLRHDKKLVIVAAAQAQKASDYILGKKFEN